MTGKKKIVQRSSGAKTVIQPGKGIIGNVGGKGTTPPATTPTASRKTVRKQTPKFDERSIKAMMENKPDSKGRYTCPNPSLCNAKSHASPVACKAYKKYFMQGRNGNVDPEMWEKFTETAAKNSVTRTFFSPQSYSYYTYEHDIDYDETFPCAENDDENGECSYGVCRCARISNARIKRLDASAVTRDLLQSLTATKILPEATVEETHRQRMALQQRLARIHDEYGNSVFSPNVWKVAVRQGYYGEEINGIYIDDSRSLFPQIVEATLDFLHSNGESPPNKGVSPEFVTG